MDGYRKGRHIPVGARRLRNSEEPERCIFEVMSAYKTGSETEHGADRKTSKKDQSQHNKGHQHRSGIPGTEASSFRSAYLLTLGGMHFRNTEFDDF